MRRWFSHLFIVAYLGALGFGIACQTLKFATGSHPAMYFVVWDMFCGWSAFETRYHIVGEGESGAHYWLTPCPWGDFRPYGDLSRTHYDYYGNGLVRMAMNTLRHTNHEPIVRLYSIEEAWPKKYNLPDKLWNVRFAEPKDQVSYFWTRGVYDGEGMIIENRPDFLTQLHAESVFNNPRLKADGARGRPLFAVNPHERRWLRDEGMMEDVAPMWGSPSAN
jgi:hypothetical protein